MPTECKHLRLASSRLLGCLRLPGLDPLPGLRTLHSTGQIVLQNALIDVCESSKWVLPLHIQATFTCLLLHNRFEFSSNMVHSGNESFLRVRLDGYMRKRITFSKDDGNSAASKQPQKILVLPSPMTQEQRVDRIPPVSTSNIVGPNPYNPKPRLGSDEVRTSLDVDDERISRPRRSPLPWHTRSVKDAMSS